MAEESPRRYVFYAPDRGPGRPVAGKLTDDACAFSKGLDLQGNTYWEFREVRGDPRPGDPVRWRRIVQYPRGTHYAEVKVPPQWHQWLRNMREAPPTIQEQHAEVRRQAQMKYLAAEADARWEAKPRVMDAPGGVTGQPVAPLESRGARHGEAAEDGEKTRRDAIVSGEEQNSAAQNAPVRQSAAEKEDPWKKHPRAGPGEDWAPQAWVPPTPKR